MAKERNFQICSYDIISNGTHKLSSVYKYFQQIAGDDLDAIGVTYESLLEKGMVFVLARMKTVFYKPLKKNEVLTLCTCHRKVKGASFIRDYLLTKDGNTVSETSSFWVLMDINSRKLCRPSVLNSEMYEPVELISFEIDERFSFPDGIVKSKYQYTVAFSDIDENNHMNNTRYPDICMDAIKFVPENMYVSEILIDYLSEARLGDVLELEYSLIQENGYCWFSAFNQTTQKKCFDVKIKFSILN